MVERPILKSFLTPVPVSERTWAFRGGCDELWQVVLPHQEAARVFGIVISLLDGTRTTSQIVATMEEQGITKEVTIDILQRLQSVRLIEDRPSGLTEDELETFRHQVTYFSRFSAEGGTTYQRMVQESSVAVIGEGALALTVLRQLSSTGFGRIILLAEEGSGGKAHLPPADQRLSSVESLLLDRGSIWPQDANVSLPHLAIVALDHFDPGLIRAMDGCSKRYDLAWMLLCNFEFREGWVGPLFIPNQTADYLSFEARLRANIEVFHDVDEYLTTTGRPSAPVGGLHSHFELFSAIAVSEAVKYVTGIMVPHLAGRLLTINLKNWSTETHEILRIPYLDQASHGLRS